MLLHSRVWNDEIRTLISWFENVSSILESWITAHMQTCGVLLCTPDPRVWVNLINRVGTWRIRLDKLGMPSLTCKDNPAHLRFDFGSKEFKLFYTLRVFNSSCCYSSVDNFSVTVTLGDSFATYKYAYGAWGVKCTWYTDAYISEGITTSPLSYVCMYDVQPVGVPASRTA